ncbi:hypothetical protein AWW66_21505 [Micromonospora rosaria]|uniref:Uncharacterized protein n=1 Tax=Micromonospora rosaria TaxID=47874 RepID=A0A136PNK0_9ACTN|nr:hypothetical protein [Micromonospora rosaria]KXK59948.1 hypothetical protein AWW66_21505 [Micromonospora rosaria]
MRHLWSFLAGLVVAPVTWVLVTLGQDGSMRTVDRWVEVGTFNTANLIEPAVYLAVGGILLGLLGTLRVSPLGPLVAGLLLVTPYVGMFVAPFEVRDRIPDGWALFGDPLPLELPVENGTLFLIGVLLMTAVVSRQRWRRWPRPAALALPPVATPEPVAEEPAPTDWPPPAPAAVDRDTAPLSLGYPDQPPPEPLPRRSPGASPWSAPPRGTYRSGDTRDDL